MFDSITDVLDDIAILHSCLRKNFVKVADEVFAMLEEDIKKLSKADYNAACSLLWREKAAKSDGSDIYGYIWTPDGFMTIDEFYGY